MTTKNSMNTATAQSLQKSLKKVVQEGNPRSGVNSRNNMLNISKESQRTGSRLMTPTSNQLTRPFSKSLERKQQQPNSRYVKSPKRNFFSAHETRALKKTNRQESFKQLH